MGNDNVKDYPPYLDYPKPRKPQTNADRLRSMSDEELAELYSGWIQDCGCNSVPCKDQCKKDRDSDEVKPCADYWLYWLRQEAQDA